MRTILMIVLFVAFAVPLSAQDFNRGVDAYRSGDYTTAMNEWRPLAEQGNMVAQYALGVMYDLGEGVAKDAKQAIKWYSLAAEQGYALAQYALGVIYERGAGVTLEPKEAVKWYRRAAEQGYALAQYALGVMYDNGLGARQDNVLAHMWYNLSAANGSDLGGKNREVVVKEMTQEDISKAQSMARKCMDSDYQDCGQ